MRRSLALSTGRPVRPPIFWYAWWLSSGRRQDVAIHGSMKGSHGCTKVWDGLSHGRYVDNIWQICGPRCGTYMEDASTSNWIKSSSRTEKVFFKGLKDEFFVVLFVCRTYKMKKLLYIQTKPLYNIYIGLSPIVNRETCVFVYKGSQCNIEACVRKFPGKIARKTHSFEKRKLEEYRRLYLYFGTPEESSSMIEITPTGFEMNLQMNLKIISISS